MNGPNMQAAWVRARARGASVGVPDPSSMLALASLATAIVAVPAIFMSGDIALAFDNAQQLIAAGGALVVLAIGCRTGDREQRRVRLGLIVSLAIALAGLIEWSLAAGGSTTVSLVADALFAVAVVVGVLTLGPEIFRGLDRWAFAGVLLDTGLLFLVGVNIVGAFWWSSLGPAGHATEIGALFGSVVLVAGAGAGMFALIARGAIPASRGPWPILVGLVIAGIAWISWLMLVARGATTSVLPTDFLLSIGLLLVARGGLTWDVESPGNVRHDAFARIVATALPIFAMLVSVVLELTAPRIPMDVNVVGFGTATVIIVAAARQVLLIVRERRAIALELAARAAELASSVRLSREVEERASTAIALSRLETGATPEETARRICAEAMHLDGIDMVVVHAWTSAGDLVSLASAGFDPENSRIDETPPPPARIVALRTLAEGEPWVELVDAHGVDDELDPLRRAGIHGTLNVGLRWEDRTIGALGLATRDEITASRLAERGPTIREFAIVASALLGPALAAREQADALRATIADIIERRAFRPVFQPIVDITSGRTIAYEALTRFEDGMRPDLRFIEAAAAGMTIGLETACLRAALDAAQALPRGTWLSLNVSPTLAAALLPLVSVLEGHARDIVVEVTEHAAVDDYGRLVTALTSLPGDVRVAVDDAGAGYAGLHHILQLRPQFVKLDISLVRSIDTDLARRAMVASMVSFATETGCELIAEGIESEGELAVLRALGVHLGQGYLFGRPASADDAANPRLGADGRASGDRASLEARSSDEAPFLDDTGDEGAAA